MKTKSELIASVTELKAKAQSVLDSTEGKDLSKEKGEEFDGYLEEVKSVQNQIKRIEELEGVSDYEDSFDVEMPVKSKSTVVLKGELEKPKVKGFASFSEHLEAAAHVAINGETAAIAKHGKNFHAMMNAADGMEQQTGSKGGYLVSPEFSKEIWDGARMGDNDLLSRTKQFKISGESITIPANAETSRVNGSRYGGVRGYWINEADTITNSNPTLRQIKLEPEQAAVMIPVTNKLLKKWWVSCWFLCFRRCNG